jgi:hypothetical protein
MPDWTKDELESLFSETNLSYSHDLPIPPTPLPPPLSSPPPPPGNSAQLVSPERIMVRFPGRSLVSLRTITRELAVQCVFGDNVMAQSSLSGRNNNTNQSDPEKIKYVKTLMHGRENMSDQELEATWAKYLESLKKKSQSLKKEIPAV